MHRLLRLVGLGSTFAGILLVFADCTNFDPSNAADQARDASDVGAEARAPEDAGSGTDAGEDARDEDGVDRFTKVEDLVAFPVGIASARFNADETTADVTTLVERPQVFEATRTEGDAWVMGPPVTYGGDSGIHAMLSSARDLVVYEKDYDVVLRTLPKQQGVDGSVSRLPRPAQDVYWAAPYLDEARQMLYVHRASRTPDSAGGRTSRLFAVEIRPDRSLGQPSEIPVGTDRSSQPVVSADGLTLYFANGVSSKPEIWVMTRADVSRSFGTPRPVAGLASDSDDGRTPTWVSPDGKRLYFVATRANARRLVRATR